MRGGTSACPAPGSPGVSPRVISGCPCVSFLFVSLRRQSKDAVTRVCTHRRLQPPSLRGHSGLLLLLSYSPGSAPAGEPGPPSAQPALRTPPGPPSALAHQLLVPRGVCGGFMWARPPAASSAAWPFASDPTIPGSRSASALSELLPHVEPRRFFGGHPAFHPGSQPSRVTFALSAALRSARC